jgi:hypothetical protein
MDAFTIFATTDYTFLQLESKTGGNTVVAEFPGNGVVKLRDGMTQVDNVEAFESTSTVHIRPTESFLSVVGGNMVGHGIRVEKDNHELAVYRIEGQVEGYDFELGQLAFYKVTLKRESIWEESDLPLE